MMNEKRLCSTLVISLLLLFGLTSGASAQFDMGMLTDTDSDQMWAWSNMEYWLSNDTAGAGSSLTSITNATFNATSVAALTSAYDLLLLPWEVEDSANLDWATRVLPYLEAGGSVLWEDPGNIFDRPWSINDLAGSGLTFSTSSSGYTSDITLVAPFSSGP